MRSHVATARACKGLSWSVDMNHVYVAFLFCAYNFTWTGDIFSPNWNTLWVAACCFVLYMELHLM